MGVPPTAQLFRKKHPHRAAWDEFDYALVEAVQTIDSERCHCGLPVYICHSDDPRIRFRVEEDTCEAKKSVDLFEEAKRRGDKDYKTPPGTTLRPVPYTRDGSDFSTYRDDYYTAEFERRKEIHESLGLS